MTLPKIHKLTVKFQMIHPRTKGVVKITKTWVGVDKVDCNRQAAHYVADLQKADYTIISHNRKDE